MPQLSWESPSDPINLLNESPNNVADLDFGSAESQRACKMVIRAPTWTPIWTQPFAYKIGDSGPQVDSAEF